MEDGSNLGQKVSPGSEGVVAVMAAVSAEVSFASAAAHSPNFSITMHHLFNSFQCLFLFSSSPPSSPYFHQQGHKAFVAGQPQQELYRPGKEQEEGEDPERANAPAPPPLVGPLQELLVDRVGAGVEYIPKRRG